jgi:hypothetical protein
MYFERKYSEELRDAAVLNFPPVVQQAWKKWKNHTLTDPWVKIPSVSVLQMIKRHYS